MNIIQICVQRSRRAFWYCSVDALRQLDDHGTFQPLDEASPFDRSQNERDAHLEVLRELGGRRLGAIFLVVPEPVGR